MKEFIMVYRSAGMGDFKPTPEQEKAIEREWGEWFENVGSGKLGNQIRPYPEGKTVNPGSVITDGPYMEVKEILMGATVLKAHSIEEAVEIAKGCPILKVGGSVEVRPLYMMG